ncbi:MAG: NADH-quinone oxidoreductase subunit L [Syntrophales bacterium]|jgi:NADH-quinone oxidoreductase subunit L|nr:NADH-quinone oxidoreductase subunit L [Syntrophales bacterium]
MISESLWLLLAFPALGVLVNGLIGSRFRATTVAAIAVSSVGLSLAVALGFFWKMTTAAPAARIVATTLYTWLADGALQIRIGLLLDSLAMVMVLVVLGIGFLIHIYSASYMKGDAGYRRFFVYLNLFIFFMLLLVLADNLVLTFVGWEGVGLCSYLLIGFWHQKKSACDAGRKAFIVNRIGDFGFILGMLLIIVVFQTVDYRELATIIGGSHGVSPGIIAVMSLLLFMGAMGKSAQFPLHVWLPDAMEGPTPVSALIHAATMVNAGVYLMCRVSPLLAQSPEVLLVIAAVGLITAVYAALSALGQTDIKRVLAYSTVSQIGFMFVAVGSGMYAAGIFHLVTHGIFKGLLFLGAGAVIHALNGEQEISRMGGLFREIPATAVTFIAGLLALAGVFPLAGFFSKDAILWGSFEHFGTNFWLVAFAGALLTALYCGKLFGVFFGRKRYDGHLHLPSRLMVWPLAILAAGALTAGLLGFPMFTKDTVFARFLGFPVTAMTADAGALHNLEIIMTVLQGVAILAILTAAVYMFTKKRDRMAALGDAFPKTAALLGGGFGLDRINDVIFVGPVRMLARFNARIIDSRIIDGAVNGTGYLTMFAGRLLAGLQTGQLRHYAFSVIAGTFLVVGTALYFAGLF